MPELEPTPKFTTDQAIARLRQAAHAKAANFYAMYSSVLGGIVTDPALMVLPLDDHMVHRGHGVFDTAILANGMLYQLDPHLDRLLASAKMARISPAVRFLLSVSRSTSNATPPGAYPS